VTTDPPGLNTAALRSWLASAGVAVTGSIEASLLAGGRSNLSYLVQDEGGGSWVVRRPPLGHVMPSAHDMGREYRVLAGLNRVDFPTPRAVAVCDDEEVLGARFMVMTYVPGRVIDTAAAAARLTGPQRGVVSASLIDTLAELHQVDVAAAGLETLGRPAGYLSRQLRRWGEQWELSKTRELATIDELGSQLRTRVDAAETTAVEAAIVHGDYRIDNTIIGSRDEKVQAVLDWEMATLGDPVADLAIALVYWTDPGDSRRALIPVSEHITDLDGFWTRTQLVERYADATGRSLDHLDFCTALACFKLAIIMESIAFRAMSGQQLGTAAADAEHMARATEVLSELGMEVLSHGALDGLHQ
jgi:aminoglycoside phosphotransferase (APT) family kinase protein